MQGRDIEDPDVARIRDEARAGYLREFDCDLLREVARTARWVRREREEDRSLVIVGDSTVIGDEIIDA